MDNIKPGDKILLPRHKDQQDTKIYDLQTVLRVDETSIFGKVLYLTRGKLVLANSKDILVDTPTNRLEILLKGYEIKEI
jgi:hypothetical protein